MRVRTKDGEGYVQRILEVGMEKRYAVVIDRPHNPSVRFYEEDEIEPVYSQNNIKAILKEARHVVQLIEDMADDYQEEL